MSEPLILVTNDDGVHAEGLRLLAESVAGLGRVIVCAPEGERSGTSHSITLHAHLRATPVREGWWSVSGTPVDCVYLAALHLCDRVPDLFLSGINAGYNLGTDVFYSGTVAAAAEGYIRGGSAVAVSVSRDAAPASIVPAVRLLSTRLLASGERHLLNVNGPATPIADAPLEVTRLGKRPYLDRVEQRTDLQGRPYFWIGGPPADTAADEGDDTWAVTHGRVSVTPLELDITAPDLEPARALLRDPAQEASG